MKDYLEKMICKYEGRLDWLEEEKEIETDERSKGVYEGMAFYSQDFIKDLKEVRNLMQELQEAKDFLEDLQQLKQFSK